MTELFGHKWHSEQGPRRNPKNQQQYTSRFLLWCRKTEHLTDAEFSGGVKIIESIVEESARLGEKDVWPPSYAAFVGYAKPRASRDQGGAGYYFRPETAIENKTAKERNQRIGNETVKNLRAFLNSTEETSEQPGIK